MVKHATAESILRSHKAQQRRFAPSQPIMGDFHLPNHSGIKRFVDSTKTIFLKRTTRLTSNTTLDEEMEEVFCNTDASAFTVTLPVGIDGARYRIINTGTSGNQLTITPNGTEDLLGENTSFILVDKEALVLVFEPTDGWY